MIFTKTIPKHPKTSSQQDIHRVFLEQKMWVFSRQIHLWDLETMELKVSLKGHSDQVWEVKFSTNEPGTPGTPGTPGALGRNVCVTWEKYDENHGMMMWIMWIGS